MMPPCYCAAGPRKGGGFREGFAKPQGLEERFSLSVVRSRAQGQGFRGLGVLSSTFLRAWALRFRSSMLVLRALKGFFGLAWGLFEIRNHGNYDAAMLRLSRFSGRGRYAELRIGILETEGRPHRP